MFLSYVEKHIRKAREEKWSENEFYSRVWNYLRTVDAFGKNLGDLLTYWDNKKELFWSYVSIDPALVKKRMVSLVTDKLGIYESICEDHEIEFTSEETVHSDGFFVLIRNARDSKAISHSANNADLMILADCVVYTAERLPQGILYLVTNDNALYDTTLAIVNQPKLIFPDIIGRLSGLEPLRPIRIINDFSGWQTS